MGESTAIVLDLGSKDIKAGFAYAWPTPEEPRLAICKFQSKQVTPAAATIADSPDPVHPIQSGEIVNWDVLESLIHYTLYDQLGWFQGGEGPLLMVEPALTPRRDRERLTQLMFEVFNVNGYFVTDSAAASLAAAGKLSGLVVDIGYEKVDVVPVLEGVMQASAATRLPYGGRQFTEYIQQLLAQKGVAVSYEDAEKIKLRAMKCKQPEVAADSAPPAADPAAPAADPMKIDEPVQKEEEKPPTFTLPDGQTIQVEEQGHQAADAVLLPSLLGLNLPPLAETVQTAGLVTTLHGEKEARKALAENILVCGGGAGIKGLPQQLLREVAALAHPALPPALCPIPEYMPPHAAQRAAWFGGALLAKVVYSGVGPQAGQQPVTKADYDEMGPAVVHRKCT